LERSPKETEAEGQLSQLTVEDLLTSESDVLRRIADDVRQGRQDTTAHNSFSTGHRSSGAHNSHTSSSPIETPLATSDPVK
jgi:hypothetical protein